MKVSGSQWRDLANELLRFPQTTDARGRVRLFVGRKHPFADRSGYCWRHRFVAQFVLGRKLLTSEHVHHVDGNLRNDSPENFEIVDCQFHGRLHASGVLIAAPSAGTLKELAEPIGPYSLTRRGPVISQKRMVEAVR